MKIVKTKIKLRVWNEIKKIPREKIVTYEYIAKKKWKPQAYITLAHAHAKNPLPIIISCYRAIIQNSKVAGYFKKQNSNKKNFLIQELI